MVKRPKIKSIFYFCIYVLAILNNGYCQEDNIPVKDPTVNEEVKEEKILLSGITYSQGRYFCIINNKIYEVNDKFSKFIIHQITQNTVMLQNKEGEFIELEIDWH